MTDVQTLLAVKPHSNITTYARQALEGKWGLAAGATLLYFLVSIVPAMIPAGGLIVGGPLALGYAHFTQNISRGKQSEAGDVFEGFKRFLPATGAYLLIMLLSFIGFLLLIIPGIMLWAGLSQTFFIMNDEPELKVTEAMRKSWDMMDGYKVDYFLLVIRFIPWIILSVFTLFIGLIWLIPYMYTTLAKYHDTVKRIQYPESYDDNDVTQHLIDDLV